MISSRTPFRMQRGVSARRYSRKSRMSARTSRAGRFQLSAEKAYSVRVPMPRLGATSTTRRTVCAPARWPSERGRPLPVAQRPLPSMMMPTWSPGAVCGEALCVIKFGLKKKAASAIPGAPDDRLHVGQVALQGPPAGGAQTVLGAGHPTFERLGAHDVSGLFELARVHAQVAIGGLQQALELIEGERLVDRERTHDGQPHPLVNEAVELERAVGRRAALHPGQAPGGARLFPAPGREIGLSHHTSGR